jgi:hypothetical protein
MKKIILILSFLFLKAEVVDKVIGVVNNLPITSYELKETEKKMNLSQKEALNYLINSKLIEYEIKKHNIFVDDYDVEEVISKIAQRNGISSFEFKEYLVSRGKYHSFLENLKKEIAKERLFDEIVKQELKVNDKKLKNFYKKHKGRYTIFQTIKVRVYKAPTPKALNSMMFAPLKTYSYKNLPMNLLFLFKNTKVNTFTPIIEEGLMYKRFYIEKKEGKAYLPFEKIKKIVLNDYIVYKREKILKEYFNKVKNRADINIFVTSLSHKKL